MVLLESGILYGHGIYYNVQVELASQGIGSCAYDREGYGFSPVSGIEFVACLCYPFKGQLREV